MDLKHSHSQVNETSNSLESASYSVLFLMGWWLCFLLYPLWYVPQNPSWRLYLCGGLMLLLLGLAWGFKEIIINSRETQVEFPRQPGDRLFFVILFSIASIFHLPFLFLPIVSGLDTIDHAAVPALVAATAENAISHSLGFPLRPVLFMVILLLIGILFFSTHFRQLSVTSGIKLIRWIHRHIFLCWLILAGITILYAFFLIHYTVPDRLGELNPIFRYPPLSKIILIPLYFILGLQDWVGKGSQILFTYLGAFYLYRLVRLFGEPQAGRIAAILFVFLPPIFHYGNIDMIDCGTLFFVAAVFYHFFRYMEYEQKSDLLRGILFCTFGCLYKHPIFTTIPAFGLMLIYDFLSPKGEKPIRPFWTPILSLIIPAATVLVFMRLSAFNTDVPTVKAFPTLYRQWTNICAIPQGVTLPVALLFLAGLGHLWMQKKYRLLFLLACWIIPHFILTCMARVFENVRQSLPYYMALIVAAALMLGGITPKRRWLYNLIIYGFLPGYLIYACLFLDRTQDYRQVGRPTGDLSYINFSNWQESYIPYGEIMRDLQSRTAPGESIYAPMANEPSHFYRAKYHLEERPYLREIWADKANQNLASLVDFCHTHQCRWLLVPRGKWLYPHVAPELIEELFIHPPTVLQPVKVYVYGKVQIGLWKIN